MKTQKIVNLLKSVSHLTQKLFFSVIENPLKVMKNAFCFTLKSFFVLKRFKFFSRLFGHEEERVD